MPVVVVIVLAAVPAAGNGTGWHRRDVSRDKSLPRCWPRTIGRRPMRSPAATVEVPGIGIPAKLALAETRRSRQSALALVVNGRRRPVPVSPGIAAEEEHVGRGQAGIGVRPPSVSLPLTITSSQVFLDRVVGPVISTRSDPPTPAPARVVTVVRRPRRGPGVRRVVVADLEDEVVGGERAVRAGDVDHDAVDARS